MVSVVNATGIQDIDGVLWGWKWDSTNISFSFPTGTAEYSSYVAINGFSTFSALQRTAARNDLANVASFTNLTFTETTSSGALLRYAEASSVNYTNDSSVATHTGLHSLNTAEANPPELAYGGTAPYSASYAQGDSWYNPTNYDNPVVGSYAYTAGVMHETGHNLGLKHGHATQDGHGTTFPMLPAAHNSQEYSVMTYNDFVGDTDPLINSADMPTTFMQDDIAALQYMYGANYGASAHNGDTVYSWSPTTGQEFIDGVGQITPYRNFVFMTLWDGGGNDTYDFSNYTTDLNVDLAPGAWTTLDTSSTHRQRAFLGNDGSGSGNHFAQGNIANARLDPNNPSETASLIENATGGSGNDTITGNSADNTLKGGGGDDTLSGLEGSDVLDAGAGADTLKGGGGADTLIGGANNDTLKGGGGDDTLFGGTPFADAATNTAVFGGNRSAYTITEMLTGIDVVGPDGHDTLHDIQTLSFDDVNIVDDHARNSDTTGLVTVGGSTTGAVTFSSDRDWFAVTLNAGVTYAIREDGSPTGAGTLSDPLVQLYNSTGVLLGSNDDAGIGLNSLFVFTPGTTSTYYVDAGAFSTNTGTYTVRVGINYSDNDGAGDFNGDHTGDFLWRNSDGTVGIWQMNGGEIQSAQNVLAVAPSWHVQGSGDVGGDGHSDIIWRHDDGTVGLWQMNGSSILSAQNLLTVGNDWHIMGTADFNADGRSDILWRNDSGMIAEWQMNGASVTPVNIQPVTADWHVVGTGEFNGDGNGDILWRNDSGQVAMWLMAGGAIAGAGNVGGAVSPDWHIIDTGDFNADGKTDILWRNDSGTVGMWLMNGNLITEAQNIGTVTTDWTVVQTGDLNGDNRSDIVWRHNDGTVGVWELDGASVLAAHNILQVNNTWGIAGHHFDLV